MSLKQFENQLIIKKKNERSLDAIPSSVRFSHVSILTLNELSSQSPKKLLKV